MFFCSYGILAGKHGGERRETHPIDLIKWEDGDDYTRKPDFRHWSMEKEDKMITTTLNRIRAHHPCEEGWTKLLKRLGKTKADEEPLPFSVIVESDGLDDAIWCCRAEPRHLREWRLFAVWCARQVRHLMTDPRSIAALDVAELHAHGQATDAELRVAWSAAWAAALEAAWDVADGWAAAAAAQAAAPVAAQAAAADAAARAAARADAAADAWADAWDAAWADARDAQRVKFLEVVG